MDEFQDELEGFHCSSCGAVLVTNSNTIITKCAFCNSSEVIKRFLEEKNVPKKVIPFEITKDESINSIKKHIKQSRFASSEIIEKFNIEELKAVFIPFYISDYDIRVYADGKAQNNDFGDITKFNMEFYEKAMLAIDASEKLDDSIMASLFPYKFDKLVDFNPAFLLGIQSELPIDVLPNIEELIDNRIIYYEHKIIEENLPRGYHDTGKEIFDFCKTKDFECILVPVWYYSIQYNNEQYMFLCNGQTGKTIGTIPSTKKEKDDNKAINIWLYLTFIAFIICVIIWPLSILKDLMTLENHIITALLFAGMLFFGFAALLLKLKKNSNIKETKEKSNIIEYYSIPLFSISREFKTLNPNPKDYIGKRVRCVIGYRSNNVKYQRFKNGEFVRDINMYNLYYQDRQLKKKNHSINKDDLNF